MQMTARRWSIEANPMRVPSISIQPNSEENDGLGRHSVQTVPIICQCPRIDANQIHINRFESPAERVHTKENRIIARPLHSSLIETPWKTWTDLSTGAPRKSIKTFSSYAFVSNICQPHPPFIQSVKCVSTKRLLDEESIVSVVPFVFIPNHGKPCFDTPQA